MTKTIAQTKFTCITPTGRKQRVHIQVGMPYAEKENYACPITIKGLYTKIPAMRGEDSFQALALSIAVIRSLLTTKQDTGYKMVYFDDNNLIDPEQIWFPKIARKRKKRTPT